MPANSTKRNFQTMLDQTHMTMEGVAYHDFSHTGYYSSPPQPQGILFSHPFSSPEGGYITPEGFIAAPDGVAAFYGNHRSLSEPFIHQPTNESFGSSSTDSSSCATPPLQAKYPAMPISPSSMPPRQKAKRTATACEECRKRKQKCDGVKPCQSCKEQKLDCRYREVCPTKKDTSLEKLSQLVETCGKTIEALNQRLDSMTSTLRIIERRLSRCRKCGGENVDLETGNCGSCGGVPSSICGM